MTTIPLFHGFYDGFYRFFWVSDSLGWVFIGQNPLTGVNWFLPTNDHNTTFSWFLLWFLLIFWVSDCVGWVFLVPNLLIDAIWRQILCKMIENWQNWQVFTYKWPQYHLLMVFMMVFIDFLDLWLCRMRFYRSKPTKWRQLTSNLV